MYRDNSLIPSEAVRLLALGLLASGQWRYSELAIEVRHFISHLVGPSLDLVAPPLELLRVEGLVEAAGDSEGGEEAVLTISEAGREEMVRLLSANLRAPISDINKLILALKMRFLHLLDTEEQQLQVEALVEMTERELARLRELRSQHGEDEGHLSPWLDQSLADTASRLEWFKSLAHALDAETA